MSALFASLVKTSRITFGVFHSSRFFILYFLLTFLFSLSIPTVSALSGEQLKIFQRGIYYYDVGCSTGDASSTDNESSSPIGSDIFVLGDSIMKGAYYTYGLDKALQKEDMKASVDAQTSRAITRPGQDTSPINNKVSSGLEAVNLDKTYIDKASSIIVELGTNIDGDPGVYRDKLTELTNKIRAVNSEAPLFIVNIFSPAIQDRAARNKIIEDIASNKDFSVIDVASASIGTSDNIHPSASGYKTYNKEVINALSQSTNDQPTTPTATSSSSTTQCCPTSDSGTVPTGTSIPDDQIPGKDNEEKLWNYLISIGFEPVEAAGIIGNVGQEGVFDPQSIEDPAGRTKDFEVFKKLTTITQGYGLYGFTPGASLMGLVSGATDWPAISKVKVTKDNFYYISTQTDVMYGYMKNSTGDGGGNMLKEYQAAAKNPNAAAESFMNEFENPAAQYANLPHRQEVARNAMDKYGGNAAAPVSAGSVDGAACCPSGDSGFGPGTLPDSVPKPYNEIFTAAGAKYDLDPALLAGVFYGGEHGNSWPDPPPPYGHGPSWASSSAGASGPFQFIPSTWATMGVDGNKDGKTDVQDLTDGAFGAAHYLTYSGAKGSDVSTYHDAIFSYNHAEWYVADVMAAYKKFGGGSDSTASGGSASSSTSCGSEAGENGWDIKGPNAMVVFDQCDPKWGGKPYGAGKTSICESGCGITSLAMIVDTLTGKNETPLSLANKYGARYHTVGTDWSLWPVAANDFGLKEQDIGTNLDKAAAVVKAGGLVMISVNPGAFTSQGHFMIIRAVNDKGEFYLADPNYKGNMSLRNEDTNNKAYSADFLRTKGAMIHLWSWEK